MDVERARLVQNSRGTSIVMLSISLCYVNIKGLQLHGTLKLDSVKPNTLVALYPPFRP